MAMAETAESYCARAANTRLALARTVYFSGEPGECDGCTRPLAQERYFADCELPGRGAWGNLCSVCVAVDRVRFAWGRGQLYQRVEVDATDSDGSVSGGRSGDSAWLLVAGFAPIDAMDESAD